MGRGRGDVSSVPVSPARYVWVGTIWMDNSVLLVTCILLINNEKEESVRS